jgi:predicted oxidoreductase
MMFGDQTAHAEAAAIVGDAHSHSHGVNFIDTADVYSRGGSEAMLGDLRNGQRHEPGTAFARAGCDVACWPDSLLVSPASVVGASPS